MLRVVLDVNVLISAALTPNGEARAILRQARVGYNLLLSDFIFTKVELDFCVLLWRFFSPLWIHRR